MLDDAVRWLMAHGRQGQWGAEPFSAKPDQVALVQQWAGGSGLWIAETGGAPAGAMVLGPAPSYVPAISESELYVQLLVTARRAALLRVDCCVVVPAERMRPRRAGPGQHHPPSGGAHLLQRHAWSRPGAGRDRCRARQPPRPEWELRQLQIPPRRRAGGEHRGDHILGAVRPFIGTVFGIIIYALDRAGLLPLQPPETGADPLYFYAAIAFFAGFSERWAQSTLKNAIPLSGRSTARPDTHPPAPQSESKSLR
jgi:hypothetical protein